MSAQKFTIVTDQLISWLVCPSFQRSK